MRFYMHLLCVIVSTLASVKAGCRLITIQGVQVCIFEELHETFWDAWEQCNYKGLLPSWESTITWNRTELMLLYEQLTISNDTFIWAEYPRKLLFTGESVCKSIEFSYNEPYVNFTSHEQPCGVPYSHVQPQTICICASDCNSTYMVPWDRTTLPMLHGMPNGNDNESSVVGAIVGGTIAAVFAVIMIIVIMWIIYKRRLSSPKENVEDIYEKPVEPEKNKEKDNADSKDYATLWTNQRRPTSDREVVESKVNQ